MLASGLRKKGKKVKVVWETEIVNSYIRKGRKCSDRLGMDLIGNSTVVACRPVAKQLLYKQRPLLGSRFLTTRD
jgi:hypothetical protein